MDPGTRTDAGSARGQAFLWPLIPFVVILAATLAQHAMWRDELQSFGIAAHSSTLSELGFNARYEPHPRVWYWTLYLLKRITPSPRAMQCAHLVFATLAVWVFLARAPFSRTQKTLFALGYYPLFEYGVISRGYVQGELLAFLFCACACALPRRRPALCVAAFLLPQTTLHSLFLGAGLGAAIALEAWRARAQGKSSGQGTRLAVLLCLAAGAGAAVAQVRFPPDVDDPEPWVLGVQPARGLDTLCLVERALLPVPALDAVRPVPMLPQVVLPTPVARYWCSNALDAHFEVQLILAVVLLGWAFWLLPRGSPAIACMGVSMLCILGFSYAKSAGQIRHQGHMFLALLCALWLAAREGDGTAGSTEAAPAAAPAPDPASAPWPRRPHASAGVTALLLVNAVAGLAACAGDWRAPLSHARDAARFIEDHGLAGATIVGEFDGPASAVSILLGRPIYDVQGDRRATFVLYDRRRQAYSPSHVAEVIAGPGPVLWLTNRPVDDAVRLTEPTLSGATGFRFELLASFTGAVRFDEDYWIYRVEPVPPPPGRPAGRGMAHPRDGQEP